MKKLITIIGGAVLLLSTTNIDREILVKGKFNENLFKHVHSEVAASLDPRTPTLVITSPGGRVTALKDILSTFKRKEFKFDTYVDRGAASAAAILFLSGDDRMVAKDAELLFHRVRVHIGDLILLPGIVEYMLKHDKLPKDLDAHTAKGYIKAAKDGSFAGLALMLSLQYGEYLRVMSELDEKMIEKVIEITKLKRERVEKEILHPYNDITLDAEKALALNIATKIGYESKKQRIINKIYNFLVSISAQIVNKLK